MARTASNNGDELTEDQLQNWKLLETFERRRQHQFSFWRQALLANRTEFRLQPVFTPQPAEVGTPYLSE